MNTPLRAVQEGALAALVTASATASFVPIADSPPVSVPVYFGIAAVTFAAGRVRARISARGASIGFTPNDLPLVIGWWVLPFPALVLAFAAGALPALWLRFRGAPKLIVCNLALYGLQLTVFALAAGRFIGSRAASQPRSWVAVMAAIVLKELVTCSVVAYVAYRKATPLRASRMAADFGWSVVASLVVGCAGLLAVVAWEVHPMAPVLVMVLVVPLVLALRGQVALAYTSDRLARLQQVTAVLAKTAPNTERTTDVLREAALALETPLLRIEPGEVTPTALSRVLASQSQTRLGTLVAAEFESSDSLDEKNRAELFDTIALQIAQWLDNARLEDELGVERERRLWAETHDQLTGLFNRAKFIDLVAAQLAAEPPEPGAVLVVELAEFNEIVDLIGRGGADRIVRLAADRIADVLPFRAQLAKLAGDEFGILVAGYDRPERVETLIAAIVDALLVEVDLAKYDEENRPDSAVSMPLVPRVGWAITPADGTDPVAVLEQVNTAIALAITTRVPSQRASGTVDEVELRRRFIHADLRRGIRAGELILHFQPKLVLATGEIVGAEALVRWEHPRYGLVMPNDFIPYAERSGLIGPLSLAVLELAVAQLSVWRGTDLGNLSLAVNIDPASIADTDILGAMTDLCADRGVPLSLLVLELTERSVLDDESAASALLSRVVDLGVRVSIDDFGTGAGQLEYLQRLPIHELKIDRSLVKHLGNPDADDEVVRGIIELSRRKRLTVVAEGIEDLESLDRLRRLGCDLAQGYVIARPMPGAAFEHWMENDAVRFRERLTSV